MCASIDLRATIGRGFQGVRSLENYDAKYLLRILSIRAPVPSSYIDVQRHRDLSGPRVTFHDAGLRRPHLPLSTAHDFRIFSDTRAARVQFQKLRIPAAVVLWILTRRPAQNSAASQHSCELQTRGLLFGSGLVDRNSKQSPNHADRNRTQFGISTRFSQNSTSRPQASSWSPMFVQGFQG